MVIKSKKTNFRDRNNKTHYRKTKKTFMRGGEGEAPKVKWYQSISKIWTKPEKFAIKEKRLKTAKQIKAAKIQHIAVQLTPEQIKNIRLKKIVRMLKNHDKAENTKEKQRQAQEKAFAKQQQQY